MLLFAFASCHSKQLEYVVSSTQTCATAGHVIDTIYNKTISMSHDTSYVIRNNDTVKYIDHMYFAKYDTVHNTKFIVLHDTIDNNVYIKPNTDTKKSPWRKNMITYYVIVTALIFLIVLYCCKKIR